MKKLIFLSTIILGFSTLVNGQWQSISTPEYDPNYNDCSYSFCRAIASNSRVYWSFSENCAEGGMGQSFHYEIFSSSNNGSSWTSKLSSNLPPSYVIGMDFISADTGYFIDVYGNIGNNEFYRTSDGLNNYQYCYYENEHFIRAVEMINYNDIYLFDNESNILHLENDTFNLVNDLPIELFEYYSLKPTLTATPSQYLFLACKTYTDGTYANDLILKSQDGGNSWDTSFISNTMPINALCFANDSLGFAAGDEGRVIKTQDSGQSWEVLTSGSYSDLFCIDFMNDQTWMVGGANATLLLTEDSGNTWNEVYLTSSSCIVSLLKFPEKDDKVYIYGCGFKWASIYDFTNIPTQINTPEYFNIYPNPTKDHFTMENKNIQLMNADLEIFNLFGEKVFSLTDFNDQEIIDCSNLPLGIYLIRIVNQDKRYIQRLVIQ